jgi:rhamnose transport system substrate-binding protein
MERMASGFQEAARVMGVTAIVQHPEDTTAEAQIVVINNLVAQGVNGIAIAANDPNALQSAIQAARDQGITVITLDSDTAGSDLFVNQAGVFEVAQVLVDSVYDMAGGSGQFALLSATSVATNQNAWIAAMHEIIAGDAKYANLDWVATVYGDDEAQKSFDEAQSLLVNFPDLRVIVAPTTVGILAAAQVVGQQNSDVLVAGLGLPSEMLGVTGEGLPCPYMYLWNPIELGEVAGYALGAIANGDTTGAVGQSFTAPNGKTYTVIAAAPDVGIVNSQIIVGLPFRFDGNNIAEWAQVY